MLMVRRDWEVAFMFSVTMAGEDELLEVLMMSV